MRITTHIRNVIFLWRENRKEEVEQIMWTQYNRYYDRRNKS